jgi:hypothetical protein
VYGLLTGARGAVMLNVQHMNMVVVDTPLHALHSTLIHLCIVPLSRRKHLTTMNDNVLIALDRLKFYAKDAILTVTQVGPRFVSLDSKGPGRGCTKTNLDLDPTSASDHPPAQPPAYRTLGDTSVTLHSTAADTHSASANREQA